MPFPARKVIGVARFGWQWCLHPLAGDVDECTDVGPPHPSREAALAWVASFRVETPYVEEGFDVKNPAQTISYVKYFAKHSPLEWFFPWDHDHCSKWGHGLREVVVDFVLKEDLGPV